MFPFKINTSQIIDLRTQNISSVPYIFQKANEYVEDRLDFIILEKRDNNVYFSKRLIYHLVKPKPLILNLMLNIEEVDDQTKIKIETNTLYDFIILILILPAINSWGFLIIYSVLVLTSYSLKFYYLRKIKKGLISYLKTIN